MPSPLGFPCGTKQGREGGGAMGLMGQPARGGPHPAHNPRLAGWAPLRRLGLGPLALGPSLLRFSLMGPFSLGSLAH